MNLSPTRSYRYGNYSYYHLAPPFQNRAEITMGMMKTSSVDPLDISSTSYGTNANTCNADVRYVTSAEYMAKYEQISNTNTPEGQKPPLNSTVDTVNNIYKTQSDHLTETNNKYLEDKPYSDFPNIQDYDYKTAKNYAAVKSNYNVFFNDDTNKALTTLNSLSARSYQEEQDLSDKVNGYINVHPAMFNKNNILNNNKTNSTINSQAIAPTFIMPIVSIFSERKIKQLRKETKTLEAMPSGLFNISA
ncbi:MAG: hypothetical protein AB1782_16390 [Cyanobacteriota bacterium]